MHKDFYASGFLYHPRSQQILLQQENTVHTENTWSLFKGKSLGKEASLEAFRRIIYSCLRLEIKPKDIYPIYNYFHTEKKRDHYIYYARVRKLEKFNNIGNAIFSWFTFKQIHKINISEQTRQDIIVGQRVIDSSIRKSLGQKTIG